MRVEALVGEGVMMEGRRWRGQSPHPADILFFQLSHVRKTGQISQKSGSSGMVG